MARRRLGDKPLSEPMMVSLLSHICVTRPQWVNGRTPNFLSIWQIEHWSQSVSLSSDKAIMRAILLHCSDVIWLPWCLKSQTSRLFVHYLEGIANKSPKLRVTDILIRESVSDWWIPLTNPNIEESDSISRRHHCILPVSDVEPRYGKIGFQSWS